MKTGTTGTAFDALIDVRDILRQQEDRIVELEKELVHERNRTARVDLMMYNKDGDTMTMHSLWPGEKLILPPGTAAVGPLHHAIAKCGWEAAVATMNQQPDQDDFWTILSYSSDGERIYRAVTAGREERPLGPAHRAPAGLSGPEHDAARRAAMDDGKASGLPQSRG
jgi:hypothetical protein